MAAQRRYNLRPQATPAGDSTLEGGLRVFIAPSDMAQEGLIQGDYITIRSEHSENAGVAIAWRSTDNIGSGSKTPSLRISDWLRTYYSLELKDKCFIKKWNGTPRAISTITLSQVTGPDSHIPVANLIQFARNSLEVVEGIYPTGTIEVTPRVASKKMRKQRLLVQSIEPADQDKEIQTPYFFDCSSQVIIHDVESNLETSPDNPRAIDLKLNFDGLIGHDETVEYLKTAISEGMRPDRGSAFGDLSPPILIHGPSGTGKSNLLRKLSTASWRKVITISKAKVSSVSSKTESSIAKLFLEAIEHQPSLIIMPNLHQLVGKEESEDIVSILREQLANLEQHRVQVVGTTVNMFDIHSDLLSYFERQIELSIPSATIRLQLLQVHVGNSCDEDILKHVAQRTHAYVSRDLRRLCRVALEYSSGKLKASQPDVKVQPENMALLLADKKLGRITMMDFEHALQNVRPSAMHGVQVEVPNVYWSDIGGSEGAKSDFRRMMTSIIPDPELIKVLPIRPCKGILLHGPPGCSKTLMARAFATESGFNFLSVKGPELISKYVGDTEYNIRQIFQKARRAAPAAIFFDEFDSMAQRDTGHSSLSPVTALLAEMDGVETFSNVIVIAATNRPELIDVALLRPGRFDKLVYVGRPNEDARVEILKIHSRKLPLDDSVVLENFARQTDGWSGADLAQLCDLAVVACYEECRLDKTQQQVVMRRHFEAALPKVTPQVQIDKLTDSNAWAANGVQRTALP
ncbi:AAA-domain-containing protein [Microthyrium microscopicum]|uniref:AAA-domain-containing protein n=1 Tax=Microthyrium microscopicum TaxID=703497 RepID=A0A6A6U3T0_9PEZI|nr:AAA-domain-containing protein [Microthyrium microscopicum]